jgi:hypothetical protein
MAQFWRDSSIVAPVRWYRCQPGAAALPLINSFSDEEEKGLPWRVDPLPGQVGMIGSTRVYDKGATPVKPVPNGTYVGTPEQWSIGSRVNVDLPLPCDLTGASVQCLFQLGAIGTLGMGRRQTFDGINDPVS